MQPSVNLKIQKDFAVLTVSKKILKVLRKNPVVKFVLDGTAV